MLGRAAPDDCAGAAPVPVPLPLTAGVPLGVELELGALVSGPWAMVPF